MSFTSYVNLIRGGSIMASSDNNFNSIGTKIFGVLLIILLIVTPITIISGEVLTPDLQNFKPITYNIKYQDNSADSDILPLSREKTLKWKYETPEGSYISTPALVDLTGDGNLEVVFISDADSVYALSSSGEKLWKNNDYTISRADEFMSTTTLYLLPIFSSVTPADILGDDKPELLFGAKNFVVCLDSAGNELWKSGESNRYFISTPVVTNLGGDIYANKSFQEIVVIKDHDYQELWPEVYSATGQKVWTLQRPTGWQQDFGMASISTSDLDGSDSPDSWKDMVFGNRYSPIRLYSFDGNGYSREIPSNTFEQCVVYGTGAVGNFTGNEEYEYFIGSFEPNSGTQLTLANSRGWYYLYDPINGSATTESDYRLTRKNLPTTASGILSSPAVGDVQQGIPDPNSGTINYEGFITSHNGRVYCIDLTTGNILWSFNTGTSITSSPALCNIGLDNSLEVIIASNNGKIYCLDGDPSDGNDEGISDSGGSNYDIIWEYDTGGNGSWVSSPVVADIDNDSKLEVIIGDKDGIVWCLNAGSTFAPGQRDWPMFQHDSQNTGVYPIRKDKFDISLELLDGTGSVTNTCYSRYSQYTFRANIIDNMGFEDLFDVQLTIDPEGYNIELKWSAATKSFIEVNDQHNVITFLPKRSNASTDLKNTWTIDFVVKFNWDFDQDLPISCSLKCQGYNNPVRDKFFRNFATVENDLKFEGELELTGEFQGNLESGDWVRGGEELIWSNVSIIYENSDNINPDPDEYSIKISDDNYNEWFYSLEEPDQIFNILMEVPEYTDSKVLFTFTFEMTPSPILPPPIGTDLNYILRVDDTPPQPPQNIFFHADSYHDAKTYSDNDTIAYVTWTSSNEELSGIKGYYYNTTDYGGTEIGTFTKDTKAVIEAQSDGVLDFYIWAIDNVGNIGPANHAEILIDSEEVEFSTPHYKNWFNSTTILFESMINDSKGSGIDPASIQYSIKLQSLTTFGPWIPVDIGEDITWLNEKHTSVKISKAITFQENGINYIRLRAKDLAGNGFTYSDYIRVMIDNSPPIFIKPGVTNLDNNDPRYVKCNITIEDISGSGINTTQIWYKYSTSGIGGYSIWNLLEIEGVSDEFKIEVDVALQFDYGKENYICWRAKDLAGNTFIKSGDIRIIINSPPIIKVTSPKDVVRQKYYYEDSIEFDARNTFDIDEQDSLTFFWKTRITTITGQVKEYTIGNSKYFFIRLQPGNNNITIYVNDGISNVSKNIDVFVYDKNTDLDDDKLPDWWEESYYGLDPEDGSDAGKDLDGDGVINIEEFLKGTNPADSEDYPGKKQTKATEEEDFISTYLFIYLILIIIIIVILVSMFLAKRSLAKKRQKKIETSAPIVVRREDIGTRMSDGLKPVDSVHELQIGVPKQATVPKQEQVPKLPSGKPKSDKTQTQPKTQPAQQGQQAPQPGMTRRPVQTDSLQNITQVTQSSKNQKNDQNGGGI
jgi:hypothetical protein